MRARPNFRTTKKTANEPNNVPNHEMIKPHINPYAVTLTTINKTSGKNGKNASKNEMINPTTIPKDRYCSAN